MWCYTLFPKILNMSLTAGIVIILVLLARMLLKTAPKIFSYALWAVVLFRLLCPVSFSSNFSLLSIFNSPTVTENSITYIPADIVHTEYPQVDLPISGISNAVNDILPQGAEQVGADPLEAPMSFATLLWLFGMGTMLAYSIASLLSLRRKLVGAVWLRDNIYLVDHIVTPFVIGVVRPKIYLPSTLSEREREYIILHEQTHIRRLDHIVKLVSFLALSVHWFNPLVWVAFVLSGKDMEMSCDEAVMKKMDNDIRADYSASLLSLATGRKIFAGAPLAFGEGDTKSRIKNVLSYKKPAFWIMVAAVVVCTVLTVCLIVNPYYKEEIMVNDTLYERDDQIVNVLPTNSYEIGMLESILHNQRSVPERNFQGVGLDEKYAGNRLYQSGINDVTIYLEDFSGFYIPFIAQESELKAISDSGLFSYSVSDIEKIEFQNGDTGELVSYTGEAEIGDIVDHLNAFRYNETEQVASDGWTYAIRIWFKDDADMQRITLTPSSASIEGNHYISSEHDYFPKEWLDKYCLLQENTSSPEEVVHVFFQAFEDADYEGMKPYCTQECIDTIFNSDDVLGMKWAKAISIEASSADITEDDETTVFVSIEMEIVPADHALYGSDQTSFFVILSQDEEGTWLIDRFVTG